MFLPLMRRRIVLTVVAWLLVVAAIGSVILALSRQSEPQYNGKGILQWTAELSFGTPEEKEQARVAFTNFGPSAVPYLIRLLEKEDSGLSPWLKEALQNVHYPFLFEGGIYRGLAANALREMSPAARGAVPALEKVAGRADHIARFKAKAALMVIRAESTTALAKTLEDRTQPNWSNWVVAASIASELGDRARPLIPLFIAALEDTNSRIRFRATLALGTLALEPDLCVPAVLKTLNDSDPLVRGQSLFVLHRFPGSIAGAQAEVERCLRDPEVHTRLMAVFALTHALPSLDSNSLARAVQPLLKDPDAMVRDQAENLLKELRKAPR